MNMYRLKFVILIAYSFSIISISKVSKNNKYIVQFVSGYVVIVAWYGKTKLKSQEGFRLADLHFTFACYKDECHGLPHFDCEHLAQL